MSLGACFQAARKFLTTHNIASADLDAGLLLEWVSATTRLDRLSNPDKLLDAAIVTRLDAALMRRVAGEPTFRIIGAREFYGRDFALSPDTLEPRPDTETLVDLVLPFIDCLARTREIVNVLDMGTGTGAIAITLAAEKLAVHATGVDIAEGALTMALQNAENCGVTKRFKALQSDWFENVAGSYDVIVSNPPYIPHQEIETLDVGVRKFDPMRALDGGADGLDFYRALAVDSGRFLTQDGAIALEIGQGQARDVEAIFVSYGYQLAQSAVDLAGIIRALLFTR